MDDFYIRAVPRLKLPAVRMADGPLGVRNYGPSNAYPAGIALAASWDAALVERVGKMMGQDARARGVDILLGPGVNIYRAPMCGRNFEYFGEDPFLASRMAVAVIDGIQSQGVIATVKHYAANNQEWDRHNVSSDVDERTLREIYLPTFEAAVKEAKVGAIMAAYNLVNGVHMTQHDYLNNQVAKKGWGFDGILMSDWDSTYDGVAAANGGLDLEMPYAKFMNREALLPAVQSGKVSEASIDEKVRRILRTLIRFGVLDRGAPAPESRFNQEGRQVAREAALSSMVLVKNDGILPLDKKKTKTVAVIGPTAHPAVTGGGGSSRVEPITATSFLTGISDFLGSGANVLYAPGIAPVSEVFESTRFRHTAGGEGAGLLGEYFDNSNLEGKPALVRSDERLNFRWGRGGYASGGPTDHFAARWTGEFVPDAAGEYRFYVSGDDGYRLWVDGALLLESWRQQSDTLTTKTLRLQAGRPYKVRLEYFEDIGDAVIGFGISRPGDRSLQEAQLLAARADAVVLAAGFDPSTEGEGWDRTFELPAGQEELIEQVLAANRNTVVVLTGGGGADMTSWIDRTPAVLHAWYPGQEGGTALARILFGEVSPSGKLPASLERRWEDNPTSASYYDPDKDKRVAYSEGVFVGYRGFERSGKKPLFAFGHGLSYTTFKYSKLAISPTSTADGMVTISFDVTNTGKRAGAEVAQVYVGDGHSKVERPAKELKGFAKLMLKPGETRRVTVKLDRRAFSYYDADSKHWTATPGEFSILVGGASNRIELRGVVNLAR